MNVEKTRPSRVFMLPDGRRADDYQEHRKRPVHHRRRGADTNGELGHALREVPRVNLEKQPEMPKAERPAEERSARPGHAGRAELSTAGSPYERSSRKPDVKVASERATVSCLLSIVCLSKGGHARQIFARHLCFRVSDLPCLGPLRARRFPLQSILFKRAQ